MFWAISNLLAFIANVESLLAYSSRNCRVHTPTCTRAVRMSTADHNALIRDQFEPELTDL